jgi:hypothetical protein
MATSPEIRSSACADITLKPNQPTDRIHAPRARNGIDDGGCAAIPPSFEYRPRRAPSITTATRPIQPPKAWTTTLPAKSWNSAPNVDLSQAWIPKCWFQAMPSKNGYRKPTRKNVAASCGLNFERSAIPPDTIAGMAAANVSRKKNRTSS